MVKECLITTVPLLATTRRNAIRNYMISATNFRLLNLFLILILLINTASATITPSPQITVNSYPGSLTLGQKATISISGKNNGGDSPEAYISVSFPDNPSNLRIVSSTSPNYKVYAQGATLWGGYGQYQLTAQYPFAEGWAAPWQAGNEYYLTVEVTPEKTGEFYFFVKMTAKDSNTDSWLADPSSSSTKDQQNEYVNAYTIKVQETGTLGSTPAPTPAITQKFTQVSTQNIPILEKAAKYQVPLDTNIGLLDSVSLSSGTYYVVSYSNLFPYAGGIEVLSSDGEKISRESDVESVFTSIGWKEASAQIKPSDIQTLRDVLQTSRDIDSSVSPVLGATSTTLQSINSLKGACVSVPFVGKKCAWDAVSASFPGIDTLANQLESFNSELVEWKSAASSVGEHLPNVISGIEMAQSGGKISSQIQSEISQSLSDFGILQSKTNQMSSRLASISSTLSSAESGLRNAAGTPVVGLLITPVADAVDNMRSEVESLREEADAFSRSMKEQSAKLSAVTDAANRRTVELKGLWNARQNASTKIYFTLGGIIAVVLVIISLRIYKKKIKSGETVLKIPRVKWNIRNILGIIIAVGGLFLLLYSFITANNLVGNEFTAADAGRVGARFIFLIFMIGIGSYLIGKGATLTDKSNIIGLILAPVGLLMLIFMFIVANSFVNEADASIMNFVKIFFFFGMAMIGGYLTGKGITLMSRPKTSGSVITPIGIVMLLFSFITANKFFSGEFVAGESLIVRILFFIFMIGIGGYLTGRGVSDILKSP